MLKIVVKYLLLPSALFPFHAPACKLNNPSVKVIPASTPFKIGHTLHCIAKVNAFTAVVSRSFDTGDGRGALSDSGLYTAPALTPGQTPL